MISVRYALPRSEGTFAEEPRHVRRGEILQGQAHRQSRELAFVDGQDNFQGPASCFGVHIRRAVLRDRLDHIRVKTGVAVAVNVGRGLLQAAAELVVRIRIREVPDIDVVAGGSPWTSTLS